MLDFNDAASPAFRKASPDPAQLAQEKSEIREALVARLPVLVMQIWPAGKRRHNKLLIGDVAGGPGDSLELLLTGPKAGLWTDRATGDGGDVFDLVARYHGLDVHGQFAQVMQKARDWLGLVASIPAATVAAMAAA